MNTGHSPGTGLQGEIEALLRECHSLHPVRTLFWELLGYDRRDEVVSIAGLGADLRSSVIEARFFASHDKFHLYHFTMTGESLTRLVLRKLYRSFRRKHRFLAFLVGNVGQANWYLAYQPDDLGLAVPPGRLVTIRLGHGEENLHRQAQALHRLRTYDDDDEPLSLLELVAAYDDVFAKVRPQPKVTARVQDGIEILLTEIGRYPLLTARRERAILEELDSVSARQTVREGERAKRVRVPLEGCAVRYKELRDMLVVHNLRLCFYLSKRYAINREEIRDLFQESVIGLLRAIDLVEPARNLRFTTYAYQWVRQAITRWIISYRLLIRHPAYLHELPKEMRSRVNTVPLEGGDAEGLHDLFDESMRTPSSDLDEAEQMEIIRASLRTLHERHAAIIGLRFGLSGSEAQTLEAVARSYGLTRERIRQIEEKSLGKLRIRLQGRFEDWNEANKG